MKFILFHGAFGNPNENWLPMLASKLREVGQEVVIPAFPVDDWDQMVKDGPSIELKNQNLSHWLRTFEDVVKNLDPKEKLCFVGHSLGCVFILHAVEKFGLHLDSAIFVSPFFDTLDRWEFNHANHTFYKTDFDFEKLKNRIPVSYVLYSDDDPYVTKGRSILFGKALDSSTIPVRRAGHFNASVNLNEFPLVMDLCMTRIDLSLYQKYLAFEKKQTIQEAIISGNTTGSLRISPEDVTDEGIFHFQHLSKRGFCTLYSGLLDFWNPESEYMKCARIAANRVKDFTRVIVLAKDEDIHNSNLRHQIELDLKAGITLRLCRESEVADVAELDFGLWDDEYVCIVRSDPTTGKTKEAELNSRYDDIDQYKKYERIIREKSIQIDSLADVDAYRKAHLKDTVPV